ncbi:hypothetical protein Q4555_13230 [Octadecabacter sp. 1_MG-2023]|uniref:hypothetical protein n=1 Tax=unclassified Octadecabacter TaxID=196158 RepID=UPI001C08A883|nr:MULTISPECIES: hypothetical protein [unclassified Octadecabacter]MBU2993522.1 hypothetical protein [Octadecabacter sp. B2R22]MDO6735635.1 hypothetical protein [Octadecabacter sp. 1_MG-2023]
MRYVASFLICLTGTAQAESMCGWDEPTEIRAALAGDWIYKGAGSFVTASLDDQGEIDGAANITEAGDVAVDEITYTLMPLLRPELGDVVYDVDQVDDLLETVEAEWIADAVSMTPCGPDDLPQLSATYQITEALNGQLTVLPYATDQVVLMLEAEWRGDWGLAFVTIAALLTPSEELLPESD